LHRQVKGHDIFRLGERLTDQPLILQAAPDDVVAVFQRAA
jgi:hypothetical protein